MRLCISVSWMQQFPSLMLRIQPVQRNYWPKPLCEIFWVFPFECDITSTGYVVGTKTLAEMLSDREHTSQQMQVTGFKKFICPIFMTSFILISSHLLTSKFFVKYTREMSLEFL